MTPISKEKRELIIKHKENKKTESQITEWLDVSTRSVRRIWRHFFKHGEFGKKIKNIARSNIKNHRKN